MSSPKFWHWKLILYKAMPHLWLRSSHIIIIIAVGAVPHPPPPVITSCRFDIHFDCCVCSHFTGQHSVHPLCSLTCCAPPKPDGFKSTFTTPSACTKQGKGTSTSTSIANAASQSCYASIHRANSLNTHHCRPHQWYWWWRRFLWGKRRGQKRERRRKGQGATPPQECVWR